MSHWGINVMCSQRTYVPLGNKCSEFAEDLCPNGELMQCVHRGPMSHWGINAQDGGGGEASATEEDGQNLFQKGYKLGTYA